MPPRAGRLLVVFAAPLLAVAGLRALEGLSFGSVGDEAVLRPPPALGWPGRVEVVVKDAAGTPVAGLLVTLRSPAPIPPFARAATSTFAVTDPSGQATLPSVPSAAGWVVGVATAFAALGEDRIVDVGAFAVARVELVLAAEVKGRVVDDRTGAPVAGAHVTVDRLPFDEAAGPPTQSTLAWTLFRAGRPRERVGEVTSDADGRFVAPAPPGAELRVGVRTEDGRRGTARLDPDDDRRAPLDPIRVARFARRAARLVDDDGRPLGGVRLATFERDAETTTGADGQFELDVDADGPEDREVWLHVHDADGSDVTVPAAVVGDRLEARWSRAATLEVVLRTDDAHPVADATVVAVVQFRSVWGAEREARVRTRTDADGRARLRVPPGRVRVLWLAHRQANRIVWPGADFVAATEPPLERRLAVGEFRSVPVRWRRAIPHVVTVERPDGRPFPRAWVSVGGSGWAHGWTGADGRVELPVPVAAEGHRPNDAWIVVVAGCGLLSGAVPTSGGPDARLDVGRVRPVPTAAVRGRVVLVGSGVGSGVGSTVSGSLASVTVGHASTGGRPLDAHGRFVLVRRALWSNDDDTTELTVRCPGYRTRTATVRGRVPSGEVRDLGALTLEPVPLVRVTVTDADGAPLAGADVTCEDFDEPESVVRTAADGAAEVPIRAATPGPLRIRRADGAEFCVYGTGKSPPAAATYRLPRTHTRRGRVVDDRGVGVPDARVTTYWTWDRQQPGVATPRARSVRTGPDGAFELPEASADELRLDVRAPGYVSYPETAVETPEAVTVTLERFGPAHLARLAAIDAELDAIDARQKRRQERDEDVERWRELEDEQRRLSGG